MTNVYPPLYTINGEVIKEVDSVTYLGHIIRNNGKYDKDIMRQCQQLYARGNFLLRNFHMCSMDVKVKLFNTYCSPITLRNYGVTRGKAPPFGDDLSLTYLSASTSEKKLHVYNKL